jgi:DNA polymerase-3 subunit beta
MQVTIQRATLLHTLQMISGVVEKRQTIPVLANVLIDVTSECVTLTATDLEIELIGRVIPDEVVTPGKITVSARKLLDISRALPEKAMISLTLEKEQLILRSGKSRYQLTTLPAEDFPNTGECSFKTELTFKQSQFKKLLSKVHFAMGQQDVRHYLNGALFDINQGVMKCVATDGHRLALSSIDYDEKLVANDTGAKIILPRKSVLELLRLLDGNSDNDIKISIGDNHFRVTGVDYVFTSKLISAAYPDYTKLIPRSITNLASASREALKHALVRASILSNEKFRGIRCQLEKNSLRIVANNPEQEEAEEIIALEYDGDEFEIGFNAAYLLDAVSALTSESIRWSFNDPNGGVLIESGEKDNTVYVVMPMRL